MLAMDAARLVTAGGPLSDPAFCPPVSCARITMTKENAASRIDSRKAELDCEGSSWRLLVTGNPANQSTTRVSHEASCIGRGS